MVTTIYGATDHGNVYSGEELGTFGDRQFILRVDGHFTLEENLQRFAFLPDDYPLYDSDDVHFSMGQFRCRLTDLARANYDKPGSVLAIFVYRPDLPDGLCGLLPLDAMDSARAYLINVIKKRENCAPLIRFGNGQMFTHVNHTRSVRFEIHVYEHDHPKVYAAECFVYLLRDQLGWAPSKVLVNIGMDSEVWRMWPNTDTQMITIYRHR